MKQREAKKKSLLEELEASGLSLSEFCRIKEVPISTMSEWRRDKFVEKKGRAEFIELTTKNECYELHIRSVVLKIPSTETISRIKELITVLTC